MKALALPLPARWLVHCEGRPNLTRTANTREEAQVKADLLAADWPGHDFDIYERIASTSTSPRRGPAGTPRPRTGALHFSESP